MFRKKHAEKFYFIQEWDSYTILFWISNKNCLLFHFNIFQIVSTISNSATDFSAKFHNKIQATMKYFSR